MKQLFSILLLLFVTLNSFSQLDYNKKKVKYKKLGLYTLSIATDAIADATRDNSNKEISHLLEASSVGVLLYIPFDKDIRTQFQGKFDFQRLALDVVIYAGVKICYF